MPNWAHNKLTVFGPPERVVEFIAVARGPQQHFKPTKWDLENGDVDAERIEDFSFHQLVPIPAEVMAREYDDPAYRASNQTGHDWERKLWGIKWGGSDSQLLSHSPGCATYSYTTPWSPGTTFFETVSRQWSDLTFAVSYSEESPSRGRFVAKAGVITREPDAEASPEWDDKDEDAAFEASEAWRSALVDTHDDWVATIGTKHVDVAR
jgi:hypothetical protein